MFLLAKYFTVDLPPLHSQLIELVNLSVSDFEIAVLADSPLVAYISIYDLFDRAFLAAAPLAVEAVLLFGQHRELFKAELTVLFLGVLTGVLMS